MGQTVGGYLSFAAAIAYPLIWQFHQVCTLLENRLTCSFSDS
ncbi:hypothetical protein [Laspinema olomoucense]|nr:hypothetical protein [Laspinema sp. D3c]